jgi:hypothetical protein
MIFHPTAPQKANPLSGICLYCISVTNTIYVLECKMLEPVVLARNLQFGYTMLLDDICQLVENPNRELIKRAFKDI